MGVSKNRGIPKWMVYNGKPYKKWMIWGKTHYFGNTHIPVPWMVYGCIKSPIFLPGSLWLRYQDLPEPGPPTEPLTQLGTPLPGSQVKKAAEEAKEAKAHPPEEWLEDHPTIPKDPGSPNLMMMSVWGVFHHLRNARYLGSMKPFSV